MERIVVFMKWNFLQLIALADMLSAQMPYHWHCHNQNISSCNYINDPGANIISILGMKLLSGALSVLIKLSYLYTLIWQRKYC